jgi:hypothetical protein
MPVSAAPDARRVRRVELCAYSSEVRQAEPGRDAVAWTLHTIAHLSWRENVSLGPVQMVSWGGPLLEGSAMAAFFFTIPPVDDDAELTRAAGAELVLQVMTITAPERKYAAQEGSLALVDKFEGSGVAPLFDWNRASCV